MKKIICILALMLCVFGLFSSAGAYDSPWDHFSGPATKTDPAPIEEPVVIEEPVEEKFESAADGLFSHEDSNVLPDLNIVEPQPSDTGIALPDIIEPVLPEIPEPIPAEYNKEQSLTLNSISINGMDAETQESLQKILSGLKIRWSSQNGEPNRSSFSLSLPSSDIFTYSLQNGEPYYISTNFLGESTYMIYPEDQFEEKLVTAFYQLIEQASPDSYKSLPELDTVLSMIKSIREGGINVSVTPSFSGLSQEVDPTALMTPVFSLMGRFVNAEPTANIQYAYTDFSNAYEFEWPALSSLPAAPQAVSATTGMFFGEDLIEFVNALPEFFKDNPELSSAINDAIKQGISQTNSGAPVEDADYLNELISALNESVSGLENYYFNLKIDQDANGAPVLVTVEIGEPQDSINNGFRVSVMLAQSGSTTAVDTAVDIFSGEDSMPIARSLVASNDGLRINFCLQDSGTAILEYAQTTNSFTTSFNKKLTDTNINYNFSGQYGTAKIFTTADPNDFDGNDTVSQISYTHEANGQTVFTLDLTAESSTSAPLPALLPENAVHASEMSEQDYSMAAQQIFLQIMSIAMLFM